MTSEFGTRQLEAQPMVGIRTKTTMDKIAETMGMLFGELHGYLQQSGQAPAGMPFAIYHEMHGGTVDLECGMPVASPIAGTDRIRAGELPRGKAATVTHTGHYEQLRHTWEALTAWMKSEGLEPAGAPWEVYVTDPGREPDPTKWRTDIFFPVR